MWKYLIISVMISLTACSGSKGSADKGVAGDAATETCATQSIAGQWFIENIVENDSSYVRPAEIETGVTAYIDFNDDGSFGIVTNCNHLGGEYSQTYDTISLTNVLATEMACDNMEVEDMLKKILPLVNTVDFINDSVARLNTDSDPSYIVLKKKRIQMK